MRSRPRRARAQDDGIFLIGHSEERLVRRENPHPFETLRGRGGRGGEGEYWQKTPRGRGGEGASIGKRRRGREGVRGRKGLGIK
jgi:hypothetical protein